MAAVSHPIAPNPTTTSTFTNFPLLPLELRLKVWHCTFSPRILQYQLSTIHILGITTRVSGDPDCYHQFSSKSPSSEAPPIALQVCHESRSYALEHYILSSSSTAIPIFLQDYPDIPPRAVYYNPRIDVVAFDDLQYVIKQLEDLDLRDISAYGAAPAFRDVRRVLLTGGEWELDVELLSKYPWRAARLPKKRFFAEFFTVLEEVWIVQNFRGARSREKLGLENGEVLQSRQRLADYLSGLWSQIPERKVPVVKAVVSIDDTTEVVAECDL